MGVLAVASPVKTFPNGFTVVACAGSAGDDPATNFIHKEAENGDPDPAAVGLFDGATTAEVGVN